MMGTPVDWWHYTFWLPAVTFGGWLTLYRFKPSIKGDFAWIGGILAVVLFGTGWGYQSYWQTEVTKKIEKAEAAENIGEQFQRIAAHYPELSDWTYSYNDENVVAVQFKDPKGDKCEGAVDGTDIIDVTCQDVYDPPESGEGG